MPLGEGHLQGVPEAESEEEMSKEYTLRVVLESPEYCTSCPALNEMCEPPMCESAVRALTYQSVGNFQHRIPRPSWCPLVENKEAGDE